ncbi:hypothetical protein ScPMuIL_005801 [Solemya velum]
MWYKPSQTIALCSLANFINSADRVIMPIAIVPMTDLYKWDLHGQGWVLSSFAVGYMSSQVIGGSGAKRYGGKMILTLAVLLWSASTFFVPFFAHSIYALVASRVVLGLGEGLGLPTIFHIFSHTIPGEERSRAFGYLVAFGSIGQTIAALVCPHMYWPWIFYLFGSLGFIWVLFWVCCYHEVRGPEEEEFVDPPKVNSTNWLPTYLTRHLGADPSHIMFTAVPYVMNSLIGVVAAHLADSSLPHRSGPLCQSDA